MADVTKKKPRRKPAKPIQVIRLQDLGPRGDIKGGVARKITFGQAPTPTDSDLERNDRQK